MLPKIRYFLFFFFLFSLSVQARFNLELSSSMYDGKFKSLQGSGEFLGYAMQLNAGHIGDYFMMGPSFQRGTFYYDSEVTDLNTSLFEGGGIGSYIGFHFYDRLKIWTGYLNSVLEPRNYTDRRYFGQHASFGIGYRFYEFWLINLEMFNNYFTQQENDTDGRTTGLEKNINTWGNILSISAFFIF